MAYGPRLSDFFRRLAFYVHHVLRGLKPGELPVARADRFELALNLKIAQKLGVSIPAPILARADRVIQ